MLLAAVLGSATAACGRGDGVAGSTGFSAQCGYDRVVQALRHLLTLEVCGVWCVVAQLGRAQADSSTQQQAGCNCKHAVLWLCRGQSQTAWDCGAGVCGLLEVLPRLQQRLLLCRTEMHDIHHYWIGHSVGFIGSAGSPVGT